MIKKALVFVLLGFTMVGATGCGLLATAISAGVAYGIYQATHK